MPSELPDTYVEKTETTHQPTPTSFSDLAAFLTPRGIDLGRELDAHMWHMINGGALPASRAAAYREQFKVIHVDKKGLTDSLPGYRPILFIDDMTPVQAAERFTDGMSVNFYQYAVLAKFTKIDPITKKAHNNQQPSGHARIIFTPDVKNTGRDITNRRADSYLEQMRQGARFCQPQQWFQLFNESLQKAIAQLGLSNKAWKDIDSNERRAIINNTGIDPYIPDNTLWTQFPDWRNERNISLYLRWHTIIRSINVDDDTPDRANPSLRPRPVIG